MFLFVFFVIAIVYLFGLGGLYGSGVLVILVADFTSVSMH